jgi:hypothetical protein
MFQRDSQLDNKLDKNRQNPTNLKIAEKPKKKKKEAVAEEEGSKCFLYFLF